MRVWDGLVFEDEEEDKTEIGVEASGALDESQTRQVLHRSGFVQLAVYLSFSVLVHLSVSLKLSKAAPRQPARHAWLLSTSGWLCPASQSASCSRRRSAKSEACQAPAQAGECEAPVGEQQDWGDPAVPGQGE